MTALIPARAGSKRVPRKNVRPLWGLPLLVWTIRAAQASGVFDRIVVSTDDPIACQMADDYGAQWMCRPSEFATDDSPDIAWIREYIAREPEPHANAFAILRPTSPFRTAATIQRAHHQFMHAEVHSLRAVQPVTEHPGKMWAVHDGCMTPILSGYHGETPWHSSPTQTLPPYYLQNASLEMVWTYVVTSFGTISGTKIAPFFTIGDEGFDINTEDDWRKAERLIAEGHVALPSLASV